MIRNVLNSQQRSLTKNIKKYCFLLVYVLIVSDLWKPMCSCATTSQFGLMPPLV